MNANRYVQKLTITRMHDDGSIEIDLPAIGTFDGFRFMASLTEREMARVAVKRALVNDTRVAEYLAMQELERRGIKEI